jgi:hypothetical protein
MLARPTLSEAAIFGWRDAQGVVHYVSDSENVPVEYREQVVTVVKDTALPPAPFPQDASALEDPPTSVVQQPVSYQVVDTGFERGYRAGLDAARDTMQPIGSIVQNVQVFESPSYVPNYVTPYPLFGPVFGPILDRSRRFHPRHRFSPKGSGRFIQGPAGPPPLGAAGPPPVSFPRR